MHDVYDECLRAATRCSRDRSEAGDLVQTVFLRALERGVDVAAPERRAWLRGALRRRAAFEARLAARRRSRHDPLLFAVRRRESSSK
jgi:RNA polymerase sigma-70 factor (ECF subfamily)